GLYGFLTDKYIIIGNNIQTREMEINENFKNVKIMRVSVANTKFAGIFIKGNSNGIIISKEIPRVEEELKNFNKEILFLDTNYTALGNLILMNDKGCIISSLLKNQKNKIERFFGIKCEVASKKNAVIGSLCVATNKGCLVSPLVSYDDRKKIEDVLDVDVDIGTANFGSYFIGACILANSKVAIVSPKTSGIELSKIEEVLIR
ncbi:MAG: translation initiation factor IF-6, partial [Candidatus Aenigmatarchaeota archaeon]